MLLCHAVQARRIVFQYQDAFKDIRCIVFPSLRAKRSLYWPSWGIYTVGLWHGDSLMAPMVA